MDFLEGGDLRDKIIEFGNRYDSIKIAVAFLKSDGFNSLKGPLKLDSAKSLVSANKRIQFLIGMSPYYITDWEPLHYLLKLRQDLKRSGQESRLQIRYYGDTSFHPKLFLFQNKSSTAAIIGSSNMTGGGTSTNIEANVSFELSSKARLARRVSSFFEDIWRIDAFGGPVTLDGVNDKNYRNYRANKIGFDLNRKSNRDKHRYNKGEIRSHGKRQKPGVALNQRVGWILNHQTQSSAEEVIEHIERAYERDRLWDWRSKPPFKSARGPFVILLLYDKQILGHALVGISRDIPARMRKWGSTFAFVLRKRPYILRNHGINDVPVRELVSKEEVPTYYSYIELHSRPAALEEYKRRIRWKGPLP